MELLDDMEGRKLVMRCIPGSIGNGKEMGES